MVDAPPLDGAGRELAGVEPSVGEDPAEQPGCNGKRSRIVTAALRETAPPPV